MPLCCNTSLRFEWLLITCFALPVLAVAALGSNIYDGWRQMYFIHAPFCMLAVVALYWLASTIKRKPSLSFRSECETDRTRRLRATLSDLARPVITRVPFRTETYGLTGVGLAYTLVQMAIIHPHQQVYFNFLVDRTTPEYLSTQYEMDYWGASLREGLEFLLERYPSGRYSVDAPPGALAENVEILPESDRRRIEVKFDRPVDFLISHRRRHVFTGIEDEAFIAPIYTRKVYGNTILTVGALDLSRAGERVADDVRESYRSMVSRDPIARSGYDLYLTGKTLNYIKDDCSAAHEPPRFFLHVVPVDLNDLRHDNKSLRYEKRDFFFYTHGLQLDKVCWTAVTLPAYDLASIRTGQWAEGRGVLWKVEIPFLR